MCTGVAARIPGSIPAEVTRDTFADRIELRIGHPAGVIETESEISMHGNAIAVHRATLGRSARRLMEGYAFLR